VFISVIRVPNSARCHQPPDATIPRLHRQGVEHQFVVGHTYAGGPARQRQQAVVKATAKAQPSASPVKGDARHEDDLDLDRMDGRQGGVRLQHAKAMAHQPRRVVEVKRQVWFLPRVLHDAGRQPALVGPALKELAQINLVAEGKETEHGVGPLEDGPIAQMTAHRPAAHPYLLRRHPSSNLVTPPSQTRLFGFHQSRASQFAIRHSPFAIRYSLFVTYTGIRRPVALR
jgi:hypothetical protein